MKDRIVKLSVLPATAVVCLAAASAQAVVVEVGTEIGNGADAALYNDGGIIGQYFADTNNETGASVNSWDTRLVQDGVFTERFRAGIMRIDLSGVTEDSANLLSAGLKIQNATQSREVIIYGLNDGDAGESWDEGTITWNTAPGLTPNPSYADIFDTTGQVDFGRWTEIGWWSPMGPGSGGTTTEFSTTYASTENPAGWADAEAGFSDEYGGVDPLFSDNLVNFLQADNDGQVSLLWMISERLGPANGGSVSPRTKEWVLANAGLTTPTIVMEFDGGGVLPGDLDLDGFVGLNDLDIVLLDWNNGTGGSGPINDPRADPSGDGFVGLDDLDAVLLNWNTGTPPASGSAVPEPATLGLLALGGMGLLRRR